MPPSPTGFMHIGTLRMALFNYIFAKQNNGKIVLRMEDTDKERSKKEYADDILDGLKWLGLDWDEGPFYQTQRTEIYKRYLQKLIEENRAYHCFCSSEELEARRASIKCRAARRRFIRANAPIFPSGRRGICWIKAKNPLSDSARKIKK